MIIIYGLGNNEDKYIKTKHNVGRVVVEDLAKNLDLEFQKVKNIWSAKKIFNQEEVYFIYSNNYMNNSGKDLAEWKNYLKLKDYTLILVHDDSDQFEENSKLSLSGGDAGHNGVKDVYTHFSEIKDSVWRLKIGIRPNQNTNQSITFVLSDLSQNDNKTAKRLAQTLKDNFSYLVSQKMDKLQNIINTKIV